MSLNQHTILDLPKYIKHARQKAVTGEYIKSLEIYKKILKIISERLTNELNDPYLIQKWQNIENRIKNECALVLGAHETCKIFQQDAINEMKRIEQENEKNNLILMRDYKIKPKNSNGDENLDRWTHFGGKAPFSYIKERGIGNENYYFSDNYFIPEVKKDPDVWDPPEDYPKYPIRKAVSKKEGDKKKEFKPLIPIDIEKKRNYDKPWKVPEVKKSKEGNKENNQKKKDVPNKSSFLLNRYPPDGEGPDTELIEMIEREVVENNPNVSFDDIAELDGAKNALKEAVLLPLLLPNFFTGLRRPWKGVLLYGPPGTGKTLLAKALATQGKTTFFNVSATTFASKWRGESEKLVRILFEMARFYGPSTIFIDEVDSVGTKRKDGDNEASRRVMAEMLVQMDGIASPNSNNNLNESNQTSTSNEKSEEKSKPKNVMVLGATNHPWDLDDALRRRFEKRVYIPLPNKIGRLQMFRINLKGVELAKDVNFDELVKLTEGYSGADISNVCREAALMPMRRKLTKANGTFDLMDIVQDKQFQQELEAPVTQIDLKQSIKNISKSVSQNDLKRYQDWTKEFSSV